MSLRKKLNILMHLALWKRIKHVQEIKLNFQDVRNISCALWTVRIHRTPVW